MIKRFLKILMVAFMIFSILPTNANATTEDMSEEFKEFLNEDGKLEINSVEPKTEEEFATIASIVFANTKFRLECNSANYLSGDLKNINTNEVHSVDIVYNYDPTIKEITNHYLNSFPTDLPFFQVNDMELINYWIHNEGNTNEVGVSDFSLDNYSGQLKSYTDHKNYKFGVNIQGGANVPFVTERIGFASLTHDGIIYFAKGKFGVRANHIIYLPDDTGNSMEELKDAAQKRIDDYVGEGKVIVNYGGEELDTTGPNAFLENAEGGYWFNAEVNGVSHKFIVIKDSSKMITPTYQSSDLITDVTVSSTDSSIPLDTTIEVETLTSGEEYEEIIDVLEVENSETYDIQLYSDTLNQNITQLDNGTFDVSIPVSDSLKDKELVAYYVDENEKITEYEVTVEDDIATFTTDHFSIYTLAEAKEDINLDNDKNDQNTDNNQTTGGNTGGIGESEIDKPGVVTDATKSEDNVGNGQFENTVDELKEMVPFTQTELQEINHGADVKIMIEINDISQTVHEDDKKAIEKALDDSVVGIYLDINIFKQVGDNKAVKLSELNDKATIQMILPDELVNRDPSLIRTYKVIYVHDGQVGLCDTEFDKDTNKLSFEADVFSTYAIVYTDVENIQTQTGDTNYIPMLIVASMISLVGMTVVDTKKKKLM